MTYECINIGDSLYQDSFGDLQVLLAPDSGLEILSGGEGVGGLNITDEQRSPSWASYTPSCGFNTAPTVYTPWSNVGDATISFRWVRIGNTVHVHFYGSLGSTTSFGAGAASAMTFSLPVAASSTYPANYLAILGKAMILNSGTANAFCYVSLSDDYNHFTIGYTQYGAVSNEFAFVTGAVPFSWGVSDKFGGTFTYEAA